jgi:hydrogenase nickel incorporation protein HypA/HybF
MHELGIAEELVKIVITEAENNSLVKVTKVNVCFGELVQIVPDIFRFAFAETVRDTIAEEAEVDIEIERLIMRCRNCGTEFKVVENDFRCVNCNSSDLDLVHGNEVFVRSIEGE